MIESNLAIAGYDTVCALDGQQALAAIPNLCGRKAAEWVIHMKCIIQDFHRAITGRWFFASLLASSAALYLSIGQASNTLMHNTGNVRW